MCGFDDAPDSFIGVARESSGDDSMALGAPIVLESERTVTLSNAYQCEAVLPLNIDGAAVNVGAYIADFQKCLLTSSLTLYSIQTAIYVTTPAVPFFDITDSTGSTPLDAFCLRAERWPAKSYYLFPTPSVRSTVTAQCQPPSCLNM